MRLLALLLAAGAVMLLLASAAEAAKFSRSGYRSDELGITMTWPGVEHDGPRTRPGVAADTLQRGHVAWQEFTLSDTEIFYQNIDPEQVLLWPEQLRRPVRLTDNSGNSEAPNIVVGADDRVHVVWQDSSFGNWEVLYQQLTRDGVKVGGTVRLTDNPSSSLAPALATDKDSNVHVVWEDDRDGNFEVYYAKLAPDGSKVVGDTRLTAAVNASQGPRAAVDASGQVHVVWTDKRDGDLEIYYTKLDGAGATLVDDKRVTINPADQTVPDIAVGSGGVVHVAWMDVSQLYWAVKYQALNPDGSKKGNEQVISDSQENAQFPRIAYDQVFDHLYIVWEDVRDGRKEVYLQQMTAGLVTVLDDFRLSSADGDFARFPALASDPVGSVHIAYFDSDHYHHCVSSSPWSGCDQHNADHLANNVWYIWASGDEKPPVTSASMSCPLGLNGWCTAPATVTLSAVDGPPGTGVASTTARIVGVTGWFAYSGPFQVGCVGAVSVEYYSQDKVLNVEATKSLPVKVDCAPPTTTDQVFGTGARGWWRTNVTVRLTASDAHSGVAATHYRVDLGEWKVYAGDFPVSGDGDHTVDYYSVDKAGHTEAVKSRGFRVDRVAPVTKHSLAGLEGPVLDGNLWWLSDVTVTLSATDDRSGVFATYHSPYTVCSWWSCYEAYNAYAGPFKMTGDGYHDAVFWSEDVAGNLEARKHVPVYIDATPPVTSLGLSGTQGNAGWWRSVVTATLTATDGAGSGVASVRYRLDGADWVEAQGASASLSITGDGVHTLEFRAKDRVGHEEALRSAAVRIDTVPPDTTPTWKGLEGRNGWWRSDVQVTLTARDATSGVAATYHSPYTVCDWWGRCSTQWNLYTNPILLKGEGVHTLQFYSVDVAGNPEGVQSIEVRIDHTPPVSNLSHGQPDYVRVQGEQEDLFVTSATPWALSGADQPPSSPAQGPSVRIEVSGLDSIEYLVRYGPEVVADWRGFEANFTLMGPDGWYTIDRRGWDKAGNDEPVKGLLAFLDNTPPLVDITNPAPNGASIGGMGVAPIVVIDLEHDELRIGLLLQGGFNGVRIPLALLRLDSDGDLVPDGVELLLGSDPHDASSTPSALSKVIAAVPPEAYGLRASVARALGDTVYGALVSLPEGLAPEEVRGALDVLLALLGGDAEAIDVLIALAQQAEGEGREAVQAALADATVSTAAARGLALLDRLLGACQGLTMEEARQLLAALPMGSAARAAAAGVLTEGEMLLKQSLALSPAACELLQVLSNQLAPSLQLVAGFAGRSDPGPVPGLGGPGPVDPEAAYVMGVVNVTVASSDAGSGVRRVEFFVDGALRFIDSAPPYVWEWDTSQEALGQHNLTVRSADNLGNAATDKLRVIVIPTGIGGLTRTLAQGVRLPEELFLIYDWLEDGVLNALYGLERLLLDPSLPTGQVVQLAVERLPAPARPLVDLALRTLAYYGLTPPPPGTEPKLGGPGIQFPL